MQVVLKRYSYTALMECGFNKWKNICIWTNELNIIDIYVGKCAMINIYNNKWMHNIKICNWKYSKYAVNTLWYNGLGNIKIYSNSVHICEWQHITWYTFTMTNGNKTYNVFDVVLKWLNCTMNAFYNSVVFCGFGDLVMLKFYNICAIGSKNGIENDWIKLSNVHILCAVVVVLKN